MLFLLLGTIRPQPSGSPSLFTVRASLALITDESGNPIGAIATGSGTATHLGQWTVLGNVKYTPDNGVIRSSGDAAITVANGDKLQVQIDGILDPVAGVDQGVFYIVGGGPVRGCERQRQLRSDPQSANRRLRADSRR